MPMKKFVRGHMKEYCPFGFSNGHLQFFSISNAYVNQEFVRLLLLNNANGITTIVVRQQIAYRHVYALYIRHYSCS